MESKENLIKNLQWNNNIENREKKEVLAREIASMVKNRRRNKFWLWHNFFFSS